MLSVAKTKALSTATDAPRDIRVASCDGTDAVAFCPTFEYVGVIIHQDGSGDAAVLHRLHKTGCDPWRLGCPEHPLT